MNEWHDRYMARQMQESAERLAAHDRGIQNTIETAKAKGQIITKQPSGNVTVENETAKIGRNEPCPCGSGKKYKKCCLK